MFDSIIGYDYVKEELETIINWYKDERLLSNEKIKLPKGILFYGDPGNGKTLFVREIINAFNTNAYLIQGDDEKIEYEISKKYEEARKNSFSLVLIDELDLLVDKNKKVTRVLQDELDGINQTGGRVLTIATTNYLFEIPDALRRRGRFDREIEIPLPDRETRKKLLESIFNSFGLDKNSVQFDFIAEISHLRSCAELISICNDVALRNYGSLITNDDFIRSMDVCDGNLRYSIDTSKNRDRTIAIHEVGHALLALKYSNHYRLLMTNYNNQGGYTSTCRADNSILSLEAEKEDIEIALAGIVCEKLFIGEKTIGSEDDLEKARNKANYLVNRFGYYGVSNVLKRYRQNSRMETEATRIKNERLANKLLKECERKTIKFFKNKKKLVNRLADLMQTNGYLIDADFKKVIIDSGYEYQFKL